MIKSNTMFQWGHNSKPKGKSFSCIYGISWYPITVVYFLMNVVHCFGIRSPF